MPQFTAKNLVWPMGGLHRGYGYQTQPPYTCYDARNVLPQSTLERRTRGGSRPGCDRLAFEQISGAAKPIRLLANCATAPTNNLTHWRDQFEGDALLAVWTQAAWAANVPGVSGDLASLTYNVSGAVVRDALPLNGSLPYQIDLWVQPYNGAHHGTYMVFALMDNAAPSYPTDGIGIFLTVTGATSAYSGYLSDVVAGVETQTALTGGNLGAPVGGLLRVHFDGAGNVDVWFAGVQVLAPTAVTAAAGLRVGFGMECTVTGGITLVDYFDIQYYDTGVDLTERGRNYFVASANGAVWFDQNLVGVMEVSAATRTLTDSDRIFAADRAQTLYIADHGDLIARVVDGTGAIGGAGNDELSHASYPDWNATFTGYAIADFVVNVYDQAGGTNAGVYQIASIDAGGAFIVLTPAPAAGTCSFRVERGPKIFDPVADTLTPWLQAGVAAPFTQGIIPTGCTLVSRFIDRMYLAGDPRFPHLWYASAQGNPNDWNYTALPVTHAVAASNAEFGAIGEPITAMIPFGDDFMVFGCVGSVWALRGDPAAGGRLSNVSRVAGIVSGAAWCVGPSGEMYFLSSDGLYYLAPGAASVPEPLSHDRLPDELRGVDVLVTQIEMQYDPGRNGFHLYLTPKDLTSSGTHWFFHAPTKSFWPWTLPVASQPTATIRQSTVYTFNPHIVLGGEDGYLRGYDDKWEGDRSTAITSWVKYGPLRLAGPDASGQVDYLIATVPTDSGSVAWAVYVGETNQGVSQATTASASGTFTPGLGNRSFVMRSGQAAVLKLGNGANFRKWSIEEVYAQLRRYSR